MPTHSSLTLFIFLGFVAFHQFSEATRVSSCAQNSAPLPLVVDILNCDTPPCIFYIDTTSTVTIKFKSPRYLERFAPQALASVMGLDVPYPLGQDDGCVGVTNTPCPLAKDEFVEYTYGMYILSLFPEVGLTLEFSLVDRDRGDEPFVCFNVQLQLKKK